MSSPDSIRAFSLQLQGELRKSAHPLVAAAVLAMAVFSCSIQAAHDGTPYPGPAMIDLAGCLRIAFLQHATAAGFVLGGVLAAVATAEDLSNGTIIDMLLREPRALRLVTIKVSAVMIILFGSALLSAAGLYLTGRLVQAGGHPLPPQGRSGWTSAWIDVGCALLVLLFIAVLGLTIAILSRSAVATVIVMVTIFMLPMTILDSPLLWITPTRWIVEWLHLDPFGEGVDYIGNNSPFDRRGPAAVAGGLLLLLGSAILGGGNARLVVRAPRRPAEHV